MAVDPLTLLRQFNINKKEIIESDNRIIFGDFSWPKDVKTNYIIKKPRKESNVKEYYTLECLLFILKNIHLIHPEYVKKAAEANIQAVRRPDRKQLLDYLNGDTTTCTSIDSSIPLETPRKVKHTHGNDEDESAAKKPRTEDKQLQKDGKLLAVAKKA